MSGLHGFSRRVGPASLRSPAHRSPVLVGRRSQARWSHPTNLGLVSNSAARSIIRSEVPLRKHEIHHRAGQQVAVLRWGVLEGLVAERKPGINRTEGLQCGPRPGSLSYQRLRPRPPASVLRHFRGGPDYDGSNRPLGRQTAAFRQIHRNARRARGNGGTRKRVPCESRDVSNILAGVSGFDAGWGLIRAHALGSPSAEPKGGTRADDQAAARGQCIGDCVISRVPAATVVPPL